MPVTADASFVDDMVANVALQFLDRVSTGARAARRSATPRARSWESVTWAEAGEQVSRLAAGLLALGLEPEQRVGIASGTRYEWILADLAVMCAGGATTTVYPSTNAEDTAYILSDSECRVVFAEDDEQIAKLKDHKAELPHLAKVVTFDGDHRRRLGDRARGPRRAGRHLPRRAPRRDPTRPPRAIGPDQLATLIYTSGTTGRPKGVRLRHRSWVYEGSAIQAQDILGEDDLRVPLAADGALVRQGADVHPDGAAATPPRSTAASTRSSTTSAS